MKKTVIPSYKILLVEDNTGDIDLIKEAFKVRKLNHELVIAKDGLEAVAHLESLNGDPNLSPKLIILDLNLPRLDGFGVLDYLKKHNVFKKIPVTVFTSSETETDILKSYQF